MEILSTRLIQVQLYAEFAPKFIKPSNKSGSGGDGNINGATQGAMIGGVDLASTSWSIKPAHVPSESAFLLFLRTSNFAPLELVRLYMFASDLQLVVS